MPAAVVLRQPAERARVLGALRGALLLPALLALAACEKPASNAWQGYVEGEFVLLASPYAGQLLKLYVRRGDAVETGKPVFALEQESERAARSEAEERMKSAQARLEVPPESAAAGDLVFPHPALGLVHRHARMDA